MDTGVSVGKVWFTPGIERTRSPKPRDRKDFFSRDVSQILLSLRSLPGSSLGWTFSLPLIVCLLGEIMILASTACISLKNKQTNKNPLILGSAIHIAMHYRSLLRGWSIFCEVTFRAWRLWSHQGASALGTPKAWALWSVFKVCNCWLEGSIWSSLLR